MLITIVTIDGKKHTGCAKCYLSALIVARRCADATYTITVDWQKLYVQHASAYSFIRFTSTADTQL